MVGGQKRDIRGGHIFKSYIPVEPSNVFSGFLIRVITINSKISILFSSSVVSTKEGRKGSINLGEKRGGQRVEHFHSKIRMCISGYSGLPRFDLKSFERER